MALDLWFRVSSEDELPVRKEELSPVYLPTHSLVSLIIFRIWRQDNPFTFLLLSFLSFIIQTLHGILEDVSLCPQAV